MIAEIVVIMRTENHWQRGPNNSPEIHEASIREVQEAALPADISNILTFTACMRKMDVSYVALN